MTLFLVTMNQTTQGQDSAIQVALLVSQLPTAHLVLKDITGTRQP